MTTRAQRNNNPFNLEAGANWFGLQPREKMTPEQAAETRFAVFSKPVYGFRAGAITLLNYQRIHHINTVAGIIQRFAPRSENNTEAYIKAVCKTVGVMPFDLLKLDEKTMRLLCEAISVHESGGWVFSEADLNDGVAMALA